MPSQIDHVVIAVKDLDEATRSFKDLGFNVIAGGEHSFRRSHNALVTFEDGSYIEIIAFLDDGPADDPWWQLLQKGEGWVDHALFAESIQPILARGVPGARGPVDGGRITPEGARIEWRTVRFPGDDDIKPPFVIEDVTERSLRVPGGEAAIHPNGVTGIRRVTSLVRNLDTASQRLAKLFDHPENDVSAGRQSITLGSQVLELYEPKSSEQQAAESFETRGPLPYEVAFAVGSGSGIQGEESHLVHGARVVFVQE